MFFYVALYALQSLNAFALLMCPARREWVLSFQGVCYLSELHTLMKTNRVLAASFAITLFSMAGIPPLAGFLGKYFILFSAFNTQLYLLAFTGALLTVISCVVYNRHGFCTQALLGSGRAQRIAAGGSPNCASRQSRKRCRIVGRRGIAPRIGSPGLALIPYSSASRWQSARTCASPSSQPKALVAKAQAVTSWGALRPETTQQKRAKVLHANARQYGWPVRSVRLLREPPAALGLWPSQRSPIGRDSACRSQARGCQTAALALASARVAAAPLRGADCWTLRGCRKLAVPFGDQLWVRLPSRCQLATPSAAASRLGLALQATGPSGLPLASDRLAPRAGVPCRESPKAARSAALPAVPYCLALAQPLRACQMPQPLAS